jgi:hypothetical protein
VEDRIKQVFGVKIKLENKEDALRAGMSADIFSRMLNDQILQGVCLTRQAEPAFVSDTVASPGVSQKRPYKLND